MLVSEPPSPNPKMILWAREQAGYDIERVAKRLQVKPEQVKRWESGRPPTVRQLLNLASLFRRPLSTFFQPEPPQERPLAAEYRRLPGVQPGRETPEFRRSVRDMLARRELILALMDELGLDIPAFGIAAHLGEDPRRVGVRLRARIGISDETQFAWRDKWQAWREWRGAIEELGVLVFMFPDVPLEDARGLALLRKPLPVAAVNTKEIAESRAFTALHEVVHLMLANAQEEGSALGARQSPSEFESVERFAEVAASYALVSEDAFVRATGPAPPLDVQGMASRFHISPSAAATRLRESNRISRDQYNDWRASWSRYTSTVVRSTGFATPVSKTIGRGGQGFAKLVIEALDTNRLTFIEAARALNLRTSQFENLRSRLIQGSRAEASDE